MGLDNLKDDDSDSGTRREYVAITRDEFEEFLEGTELNWEVIDEPVGELIYESEDTAPNYDDVSMRIFSSLDRKTGRARNKGADAIRLVLWHSLINSPISGKKKTLRIKTWRKNLRKKIEELNDQASSMVKDCPECGSILVRREGRYGPFLGCSNYPDCEHTEQVDD